MVLLQKFKAIFFTFSIMKNIIACPARFKFAVKLICSIGLESGFSACCLLKLILSSYNSF